MFGKDVLRSLCSVTELDHSVQSQQLSTPAATRSNRSDPFGQYIVSHIMWASSHHVSIILSIMPHHVTSCYIMLHHVVV